MRYKKPENAALRNLAKDLKLAYTTPNPKHLCFITLLEKLTHATRFDILSNTPFNVLMGTCIFAMESIAHEYHYLSPERARAYKFFRDALLIGPDNQLTHEEKLIYLSRLFDYVKNCAADDLVKETIWESKEKLQEAILNCLRQVINKQSTHIQHLLAGPPTAVALKSNIQTAHNQYDVARRSRFFQNHSRMALANFVDFINKTCDEVYREENVAQQDEVYLRSYMTRMGAVYFALRKIEDGRGWLEWNSALYAEYLKSINAKSINHIEIDKKIMCLSTLMGHIEFIQRANKKLIEREKAQGFNDIENYLTDVHIAILKQLANLAEEQKNPLTVASRFGAVTNYAAQYGFNLIAQKLARDIVLPNIGGVVLDGAAGTVGFVIFGPTGAVIATQLGRLVREQLIPAAVATVFANVLERIGSTVGSAAAGVVVLPFTLTANGLRSLLNLYSELEPDDKDFNKQEWIEALLSLPEELFSKDNKEVIYRTQAIERKAVSSAAL